MDNCSLLQQMHLSITLKIQISSKNHIQIDFSNSRIWDDSGVGALIKVEELLREKGITVEILELDTPSKKIISKLEGMSSH